MRFAQGKLREGSVSISSEILRCAQDDRAGSCWWWGTVTCMWTMP